MTDLDAMSALAWLLCAVGTVGGFAVGAWRRERTLDKAWTQGYDDCTADVLNHLREGRVPVLTRDGERVMWWRRTERDGEIRYDEDAAVRDVPPPARPELGDDGGGEGASGVLAGSGGHPALALETSRPGEGDSKAPLAVRQDGNAGPGHSRGYGPYLAAIGRDDPAGWYANLAAGEPAPEPGPAPEPAWVERLLHQGAISTAWCEATLHDTAEYFRADEAAVDYQIERWVKAARFQLVGSRSWPPPELEAVA